MRVLTQLKALLALLTLGSAVRLARIDGDAKGLDEAQRPWRNLRQSDSSAVSTVRHSGGSITCSPRCASRTSGTESRPCPWAKQLEGKYWGWKNYRSCSAGKLRADLECDGGLHAGSMRETLQQTLGGKKVVFIGDSTMRQTYLGMICMLWEEGLIPHGLRIDEDPESHRGQEMKGYMNATVAQLGEGTNLTYLRKDWGSPGPVMMELLNTADITVANMGMHYSHLEGKNVHYTEYVKLPNTTVVPIESTAQVNYFNEDVAYLLGNMSQRGRPGHRVFWRESQLCPYYDSHAGKGTASYGCVAEPNPALSKHNAVVAKLMHDGLPHLNGKDPLEGGAAIEVIPTAELHLPFWWAHPGGHDCCHMVGQLPGLLSLDTRLLMAMLQRPVSQPFYVERIAWNDTEHAVCPPMDTTCKASLWEELR